MAKAFKHIREDVYKAQRKKIKGLERYTTLTEIILVYSPCIVSVHRQGTISPQHPIFTSGVGLFGTTEGGKKLLNTTQIVFQKVYRRKNIGHERYTVDPTVIDAQIGLFNNPNNGC